MRSSRARRAGRPTRAPAGEPPTPPRRSSSGARDRGQHEHGGEQSELDRVVTCGLRATSRSWRLARERNRRGRDRSAAIRSRGSRPRPTRARRARARRTRPVNASRVPDTKPVASRAGMPTLRASTTRLLATCSHQPTRDRNRKSSTTSTPGGEQRRVERVRTCAAEPRLDRPDLVVGRGRGGRDRGAPARGPGRGRVGVCAYRSSTVGRHRLRVGGPQRGRGRAARCGSSRCTPRPCRSRRTDDRPSRRSDPAGDLVGLDRHRARRGEHDVGEARSSMWNVWRIAGPVERAVVERVDRDRRPRPRSPIERLRPRIGSGPRPAVPRVERLAAPEVGAGRVDGEHDPVREPRPLGHVEPVGRAQRRRRVGEIVAGRVGAGPDVAAEPIGERRRERDRGHRDDDARSRPRPASSRRARRRAARAGASGATSSALGAVDEHERDERRAGPAHEQRLVSVPANDACRSAPRAHPGRAARSRPAGSAATATRARRAAPRPRPRRAEGNRHAVPARGDRADRRRARPRSPTATGRHGDPRTHGVPRVRGARRSPPGAVPRSRLRSLMPRDHLDRPARGRGPAVSRQRGGEPAPELTRVGDRRRHRPVGLARAAPHARRRRPASRVRCRRLGSRRPRRRRPDPSGRRPARSRPRAAARARARPASRGARSSASARGAPRRPARTGRTARTVSPGPYAELDALDSAASSGRGRRRGCARGVGRGATVNGTGSATRTNRRAHEHAERRRRAELDRMVWNTPRRAATRGTTPSAGDGVRHHVPGRVDAPAPRPAPCARASARARRGSSPTVASGGAHASTLDRATATRSATTIPMTNKVNANTPTATTLCSPDAAPAATP